LRISGTVGGTRVLSGVADCRLPVRPAAVNETRVSVLSADAGRDSRCRDDLDVARAAIRAEIAGLERLATTLDGQFCAAIDCVAAIGGRIVATGLGKSGHVARKIAATLASTGTLAQFVHPVEASHGDLGMIGPDDAVLALSNSGDTTELTDIIAYTRRFDIPLIAITASPQSALASAADIVLLLPAAGEACPLGMAPTTSTTMMMALGDAMAIVLFERRGFSSADFRLFHPGGTLARRLLRVDEIMHRAAAIPLVSPEARMSDAILVMSAKGFGCVGVHDARSVLIGIITDGDLRRHMDDSLLGRRASEIMHRQPKTISGAALAAEALGLMNRSAITALFVVDDGGRPIGFLHMHDCLQAGIA
jgi:arabinose-5-phosphate isomerase